MIIAGISEGFHDASLTILENDSIVFAAHAERYSKKKNDPSLNNEIINDALSQIKKDVDVVAYYESPFLKQARLILHGGIKDQPLFFKDTFLKNKKRYNVSHHKSHAAAGYYTSKFDDAVIVVLDAIGEFNTASIWIGNNENIKCVYKQNYPVSFGLFYSAFTHLIGLKPNQEEYIMMGMAAYGDWKKYYKKVNDYFISYTQQKYNFHKGITDWGWIESDQDKFDIAAAVQFVYEQRLNEFMRMAKTITGRNNLVFMGGCALNSKANTLLWNIFDDIWIMPNPGDAGSSLGAASAVYGKHINWSSPYTGYDLSNEYPVNDVFNMIMSKQVCAVAAGKAEFGPRALGNRSILADPRDPNIKDKVNLIKQRELFRPFAPVIMAEHASEWFDMNYESPYMQYTPKCLKPELIPSVVHADGTSRVQTVTKDQNLGLYSVLEKFYAATGVPILLNTSLNIKGQPLLNDEEDIRNWQNLYKTDIIY